MGYYKQLHIDCYEGTCEAGQDETCWHQPDNPSYFDEDVEPQEPGILVDDSDRDDAIDQDQE